MCEVEVSVAVNLSFAKGQPTLALSQPVTPVVISLDASVVQSGDECEHLYKACASTT